MEKRDASGTEGFLLIYPDLSTAEPMPDGPNGQKRFKCTRDRVVFRIYEYDENGKHAVDEKGHTKFKDYDIHHHDLRIKLLDGVFTEDGDKRYIDYY